MVLCYINNNIIYIIDDINATNMINIVKTNLSVQLGDIIYDINMINMINIDKTNLSVQWRDGVDCAKLSTCGDDIVTLLAVASYLDFDQ